LRLLIQAGADLRYNDRPGVSPAMIAASRDCSRCLQLLVEAGADLACEDSKGRTALWYAAKAGSASCLRLLVGSGVVFDYEDLVANTTDRKPDIEVLLAAAARSNDADAVGMTPRDERTAFQRILSGLHAPDPIASTPSESSVKIDKTTP
jgi:hypothetical protein